MQLSRRRLLGTGATAIGARAFPANTNFVRTSGQDIVAPDGRELLLRGINFGNWLAPEGYMFLFEQDPSSPREIEDFFAELIGPVAAEDFWRAYRQSYITKADIAFIQRCGFNSVRIPLHYKFFLTDAGFAILDPVVDWCREAGLWVVLDMHCAPGGQTGTNIDDSYGYPWLYESPKDQQLLITIWKRIAAHYRNEHAVLGYDLLNEPIPHFPRLHSYNAALEPLYKRITAAIRQEDPNHIIILGGAQWDSNFDVFGAPFDHNLIYQFHKYWTAPARTAIEPYIQFRDRYNFPIWCGESGENTDDWVKQFVHTLETNGIGWCFWPYKKMEKSSCPVAIPKPARWDRIVAFSKMPAGTGNAEKRSAARPSLADSRAALDDLLLKIRFSNCRINSSYLNALGLRPG